MKNLLSFLLLLHLVPVSNGQNFVRNYWRGNSYQINAHANELKTTQLRQKTFDEVWWTINELYYDPTFGGVDWKKMKEVYQPQAMSAKTDDEFHLVLSQMVGELKRSHLAVLSKNQIVRSNLCSEGNIGVELKIIDNQAIVYQVKKNSVAEKSGLKKGFALTQIDNETVSEVIHKTTEAANQRKTLESLKKRTIEVSLLQRLCGKPNTQVKVVALDENSVPKTFELIRDGVQIVGKIGLLKKEFSYVAKTIEDNIGYIKFSGWDSALHESFAKTIPNFLQKKGIIIDLRGNRGGSRLLYNFVAAYFFDKKISFGTYKSRTSLDNDFIDPKIADFTGDAGKLTMKPIPFYYDGKLTILVDYGSASASEVFAAGMQENGRAKIIGETTMGSVLAATNKKLLTGGMLVFPYSEYKTTNQIVLEGRGVEPDIKVQLNRESLLQGRDLQIEAAINEIIGNNTKNDK